MMVAWKDLNDRQRAAAKMTFDALETMDAVAHGPVEDIEERKTIGFTDVYAFASGVAGSRDQDVRLAMMQNRKLREAFDGFMGRVAVYRFPRVAAASSGDVETREGEGFKVRLKRSKAVESQCYVMVDVDPTLEVVPTALFVKTEAGAVEKAVLPEGAGGSYQILSDWESDLVRALRDVKTEVFLR